MGLCIECEGMTGHAHQQRTQRACAPAPASEEAACAAASCAASIDFCMLALSLLEASNVEAAPVALLLLLLEDGGPVLLEPLAFCGAAFRDAACSPVLLDDVVLLVLLLTPSLQSAA